ncbi:hypothetical protein HOLleu_29469 [Holothuria leucospilota]|uniref:Uncharacterized protein n=1 Tax=Holothuria leucospilota TaxID=206669 RepID=A0A9Q1BNS2_HOLLE|nr:hypothetical protein HOLleu_29469 [Holothuria leucospilota]
MAPFKTELLFRVTCITLATVLLTRPRIRQQRFRQHSFRQHKLHLFHRCFVILKAPTFAISSKIRTINLIGHGIKVERPQFRRGHQLTTLQAQVQVTICMLKPAYHKTLEIQLCYPLQ